MSDERSRVTCQARHVSIERDLGAYYEREAEAGARLAMGPRGRRDDLRRGFVDLLVRERRRSVVEIGAGPGTDAPAFGTAGIIYAGFDLAVANAHAATVAGLAVVPGSLYAPPFRSASFDAGWTMSTLLHVPDERFDEAVSATTSLLRPNAPLAIGLWGGVDREFTNDIDHFDPPRFFSLRSDDRIRSMLSTHGTIESFESWPNDRSDWSYQFIVLRV
jgi:SAM-dependent methyltransferase